jgi:hypothetical protein
VVINDEEEMCPRDGGFYYRVHLFRVSLSEGGSKIVRAGQATNDHSANCNCRFRSGLSVLRGFGRGNRIVGFR